MKYRVLKYFTDLKDNNHAYKAGDVFPREGLDVSAKRIEELSTNKNKRGVALIEKIEEPVIAKEDVVEEIAVPVTVAENRPKKKGNSRYVK